VGNNAKFWKVQDKRRLVLAMMELLAGDARISFEGDLRELRLLGIPGASEGPTVVLARNTIWPKQDFVTVPLEPFMGQKIIAAIGGTIPRCVIHIQIEKSGELHFGAYDNFDPQCIYFGNAVSDEDIQRLISEGIILPKTEGKSRL
jgi:hypothetical protein